MKFLLYLIVFFHLNVVFFNVLAVLYLVIYEKWYIALPIISFISEMFVNNWKCPLTVIENKIRTKLGIPTIKGFVGHYILK